MSELPLHSSQLPEKTFAEDNNPAISALLAQIRKDFPEAGANTVLADKHNTGFSSEDMEWMWTHFMGRQHGTSEGSDGKLPLTSAYDGTYTPLISKLRYGTHGFTEAQPADPATHYTHSLILGGFPQEMASRLHAGLGNNPHNRNVDQVTLLVGQRLRWSQALGERSISDIYHMISHYTGTDMNTLREKSPWMREEERKVPDKRDHWSGPYATEFEIGRLCAEAYFRDLIDWKNYDVDTVEDSNAAEQTYAVNGVRNVVPARKEALVTYELKNGTKAHILNAAAVPRARGVPRPTSDSQARELIDLGLIGVHHPETLNVAVSPPHIRAGIDIFIRLLNARLDIVKAAIVSHKWLTDKEVITALGEIPATHKADLRLRALLSGQDPDSQELMAL